LTDAQEHPVIGRVEQQRASFSVQLPAVIGLPWTIYSVSIDGAATDHPFSFRSRLVIAGVLAIALFVMAGSYLIARSVGRKLAVARLQSDFVTAISHEFRTPLTALRQLSELLAKGRVLNASVRQQYYEMLEHESTRLQRLVEGLLKFGRMEAGAMRYQLEMIDVAELLRSVVASFKPEASRRQCLVELREAATTPPIRADREALGCVVRNLLDNAVKYSPEGRTVWVDLVQENGSIAIRVRDQGVGIARADHERIFKKFVRGEVATSLGVQGAGIGLAVAREIIATHGGEIRLQSEPGQGSTFTIVLPIEKS
jgi:signal transduction histidine kinase